MSEWYNVAMICLVLCTGKTVTAPNIFEALKATGLSQLTIKIIPTKKGSFSLHYASKVVKSKRGKDVLQWNFLGEFANVGRAKWT